MEGKSHAGVSAASVCQRFRLASVRPGLRTVCVSPSLIRRCFAAGPGLVKAAESGLQLTSVCQGSHAEQKDAAGETCVRVSLANGENAFSLLHTLNSPEKSLPAERLFASQASPCEERFNPSMCLLPVSSS